MRSVYAPELLLEQEAARIAIEWQGFESEICVEFKYKRVIVEVRIRQRGGIPLLLIDDLTTCQTEVLEHLAESHPRKLTKPRIVADLEKQNKVHGESTIAAALLFLRERDLITTPRQGSREGYGITDSGFNLLGKTDERAE